MLREGVTPLEATAAFLRRFDDRFRIVSPAAHLRVKRESRDVLGMTHVRLQQVERGVPVHGAEMLAHFDARGSLRTIDSTYVTGLDELDIVPELTAAEARATAEAHFAEAKHVTKTEVDTQPELVIVVPSAGPKKGTPLLAYHLDLRSPENLAVWMDYTVDAKTRDVLQVFDKVMHVSGSGTGILGDTKTLEISQEGSTFRLVDVSRSIDTYDAKNTGVQVGKLLVPGSADLPGELVTSSSATSGWDEAAVDAHHYAAVTYDFYKATFGRQGIDGQGGTVTSSVHFLKEWNNAAWNGKQMLYGDGDGVRLRRMSAAVDVIAHELTHGVTSSTSDLTYIGESGALNESMSDIFAAIVEHHIKPDPKNWLIGEDVLIGQYAGKVVRDLAHPRNGLKEQPAHMSKYVSAYEDKDSFLDLGGVHINSGIPNNAFYLATVGGTNDVSNVEVKAGIGWAKAAQVWYRTNTEYLGTDSDFEAAAAATLSAAGDLGLTQNEKNIIECAWIAVGVLEGECGAIVPPPVEADGGAASGAPTGPSASPTPSGEPSAANPGSAEPAPSPGGCHAAPERIGSHLLGAPLAIALAALVRRRRRSA
ncbi:MAG TPA: M4 family metallopeptidase [Labilithrix sp.]|nr:M4 family metallopeptidase [Labilithrix sp.]